MQFQFKIKYLGFLLLFTIGLASNLLATTKIYAEDTLTIGVFPRRSAELTERLFTPLVQHNSKKMGYTFELKTFKDFESFWVALSRNEFDIVHFNQYHYMKSHKLYGNRVILKNEELNEDTITGSIVVRKDQGFDSLNDLRGKNIVFGGGRSAMQSYIYARFLLKQAGLYNGDYIERFSISPPNAIFASYFGQAAAGGVGDKVLKLPMVTNRVDVTKLKYLARGEQLPHLPWAVSNAIEPNIWKSIQITLARLKNTKVGKKYSLQLGLPALILLVTETTINTEI